MSNYIDVREGSRVRGDYFGSAYTGTVTHERLSTTNWDSQWITVELDAPIRTPSQDAASEITIETLPGRDYWSIERI